MLPWQHGWLSVSRLRTYPLFDRLTEVLSQSALQDDIDGGHAVLRLFWKTKIPNMRVQDEAQTYSSLRLEGGLMLAKPKISGRHVDAMLNPPDQRHDVTVRE